MPWQAGTEKIPVTANFLYQALCQYSGATKVPISNLILMIRDTFVDICQQFLLQTMLKTTSRYIFNYVIFHLDIFETTATTNLLLILSFSLQVAFVVIGFLFFFFSLHTIVQVCVSQSQREIDIETCWECIVVTKEVVSQATVTTWNLTEFLPP